MTWTQLSQPWMDFIKMLLDRLIVNHVAADNEECCWQYITMRISILNRGRIAVASDSDDGGDFPRRSDAHHRIQWI